MASIQVLEIETPIEDLSYDVAGNITGGLLDQFGQYVRTIIQTVFEECRTTYPDNPEQALDCTERVLTALFVGI